MADAGSFHRYRFRASFHIHGADHELTLSIPVEVNGAASLKASTNFVVPYQAWGMKNPSTLFLHVDDKVQISVSMALGKLTMAAAARSSH